MNKRREEPPISENQKKLIKRALDKIKEEDLLHKGFLKPIEIALKTRATDKEIPANSLPKGLKLAIKESINLNKFTLQDFTPIDPNQTDFQSILQKNQNNVLSLMKKNPSESKINPGMEIAICICMYSQDKDMLKSTLAGVSENIAELVRSGVNPDDIGVFVLMDGIEKVDSTVIDYIQELQRGNNIYLGENNIPAYEIQDLLNEGDLEKIKMLEEDQMKNVNNFLFDPAQLLDRNQRRFTNVKKEYAAVKNLKNDIKKLMKERPLYQNLPPKIKPFFIEQARNLQKEELALTDQEAKQIKNQLLVEIYGEDIRKSRGLVMQALKEAERYCDQYVATRQSLAYLNTFRSKIPLKSVQQKGDDRSTNYIYMNEEEEESTFMNLFLCIKYKNAGKLSSHNWFFNGFCEELKPKYAVLLDVGLRPHGQALYKMYKHMQKNDDVGGVCGYMSLKLQKLQQSQEIKDEDIDWLTSISLKFFDIQRTQQTEYHFAHLIDKPFQAQFGFIHVLPGAFSAYNMKALRSSDDDSDTLLKEYFKSIDDKLAQNKIKPSNFTIWNILLRVLLPQGIYECIHPIDPQSQEQMLYNQNIYLAEDRILCMGIHKNGKNMAYLPDAYAEVDPMKSVHTLLGQRKRWINGSYFAFEKVKKQLKRHEQVNNNYECCLHIQILYLTFMNWMAYFSPSLFLFSVHIAAQAFRADILPSLASSFIAPNSPFIFAFVYIVDFIYVMLLLTVIFFSLHLTNNTKQFKPYLYVTSTLMGCFSIGVFILLIVDLIRGLVSNTSYLQTNPDLVNTLPGGQMILGVIRYILLGIMSLYIIPILAYLICFCKTSILFELLLGVPSFIFYSPTYLNILNIYALCRIDDISWGTKGLDASTGGKNANLKDTWKIVKFIHVGKYLFWNIIVGVLLLSFGANYTTRFFITLGTMVILGSTMLLKILIGVVYTFKYRCAHKINPEQSRVPDLPPSRVKQMTDKFSQSIVQSVQDQIVEVMRIKLEGAGRQSFIVQKSNVKYVQQSVQKHSKIIQRQSGIKNLKREQFNKRSITQQKKFKKESKTETKPASKQREKDSRLAIKLEEIPEQNSGFQNPNSNELPPKKLQPIDYSQLSSLQKKGVNQKKEEKKKIQDDTPTQRRKAQEPEPLSVQSSPQKRSQSQNSLGDLKPVVKKGPVEKKFQKK